MISFLDYIKEVSSNPWDNSGVIFSGTSASEVANRFPKVNNNSYINPAYEDITDMTEYGLVGFWKYTGEEEEITIDNKVYAKCDLYMPDSEEVVGYYYRMISEKNRADKLEIDNMIYTYYQNQIFRYNNYNYYVYFGAPWVSTMYMGGFPITNYDVLKRRPNYLVVYENLQFGAPSSTYSYDSNIRAYIDLENQKVVWNPHKNLGIWEDFKYVPGTDKKCISKSGDDGTYDLKVYINIDDEDYTPYQTYQSNQSGSLGYVFVADYQHYINTGNIKQSEKVVFDVPKKLLEKYGNDYVVNIVKNNVSGSYYYDAILFGFYKRIDKGEYNAYSQSVVIYHPATKNWCEIAKDVYVGSLQPTSQRSLQFYTTSGLVNNYDNVELNFIDQSSIDLDIYKKMADIGTGLMLFDDETEDLKYLYDTKNKELYNEYCDLVGTNAITFKK